MSFIPRSLLRATSLVGLMTFFSRILGLIRDVLIARLFGASMASDAFFVAFKIPNFFRRLFAEGAFSQAFVPVVTEYKEVGKIDEPGALIGATYGILLSGLAVVVTLGVLAAPVLILLFAPGFVDDEEKFELSVALLRITFPYLAFVSLAALLGGVLNVYRRFAVPAFTPALLNISLIIAAIFISPLLEEPIVGLAIGVLIGGGAQLLFQYSAFAKLKIDWRIGLDVTHSGVRKILRLMAPAIFGVSVAQINLIVDTVIASFLVTGSISWLYYSDRIIEFPLGVFGIALATAILPTLSQQATANQVEEFRKTVRWSIKWAWLIALPASAGIAVLASPILTTLFSYGEMSAYDVRQSAWSLTAYALGLPAFILIKILAPGYFARQDMKTPVKIGVIALLTNIVLNLLLVGFLAHVGLALATALSAWLNAMLLWLGLKKQGLVLRVDANGLFSAQLFFSTCAMVVVLAMLFEPSSVWHAWSLWDRTVNLITNVLSAMAVYFAVLFALGMRGGDFFMSGNT